MTTITPTVGRRIHFVPNAEHAAQLGVFDPLQPCDAGVIYVHEDGTVNLDVTGPSGAKLAVQRVRIIPAGHVVASDESHARWMDYQTAKAAQEAATAPIVAQATAAPQLPAESPAQTDSTGA